MVSAKMIEVGISALNEHASDPKAVQVAAVYLAMLSLHGVKDPLPDLDAAERDKGGGPSNQPRYYVHGKAEDDDSA